MTSEISLCCVPAVKESYLIVVNGKGSVVIEECEVMNIIVTTA
jgi:hypothetical protein